MGVTPVTMVLGRDMFLTIYVLTDSNIIFEHRRLVIDDDNRQQNIKRRFKYCHIGDEIFLVTYNITYL